MIIYPLKYNEKSISTRTSIGNFVKETKRSRKSFTIKIIGEIFLRPSADHSKRERKLWSLKEQDTKIAIT